MMSRRKTRALVVEDDPVFAKILRQVLEEMGHRVEHAATLAAAMDALKAPAPPDLVLLDLQLPDGSGLEAIDEIHARAPLAVAICISATNRVDVVVEAMRRGAFDYITKSESITAMLSRIDAGETEAMARLAHARGAAAMREQLLGDSAEMERVRQTVRLAAGSACTVLITGETGTGKSRVARAIHESSSRRDKAFVTVDCAALSPTLAESELFGHVRGAFTGAVNHRVGAVEAAKAGTLFFDEVSDLPAETQGKLLRVLEDRIVRPIGGNKDVQVSSRLLGATRHSLAELVEEGRFREDLFFRFSVLEIAVPPLRERRGDVPQLARHFVQNLSKPHRRRELSEDVLARLSSFEFPGNIRELRNIVERLVLLHHDRSGPIDLETLDFAMAGRMPTHARSAGAPPLTSPQTDTERYAKALLEAGGRIGLAAEKLGMSRHALRRRLKKLELDARTDTDDT